LKEPSCTILKKEGNYYLVSSEFELLTDPLEIFKCVHRNFDILRSIINLKFSSYLDFPTNSIEIDDIYHLNKDGILIGEKATRFRLEVPIPSRELLKTMNTQSPTLSELWIISQSHPEVGEALRYYYEHSYSWINLYKIYEIIRADVRESENVRTLPYGTFSKWTQGRKLDFEQSAHNAHISGENARHSFAGSRKVSGITPMSLKDAEKFIENLFLEWVKTKI
jgi:hypothetical protein